jgi:serine/threonine-protein kinase HipA
MARAAGIAVPDARLFSDRADGRWFGVARFDRIGARGRWHNHSLGGLLHASHRLSSLDYLACLALTRQLTRDARAVEEAFRRMVFNVLAHNRDDHVRNFAYRIRSDGAWQLTPAFDLTFSRNAWAPQHGGWR